MSTSTVMPYYDSMVDSLKEKFGNVEPFLIIKSSMLAKKYPGERSQKFYLELFYRQESDGEKAKRIYELVGKLPSSHGKGHYQIDLQTDLDTVLVIAGDRDLEWVDGEVYPL
ncbi:MAG: hypothetical protein ABI347_01695 [Nitrososphaera sp.]